LIQAFASRLSSYQCPTVNLRGNAQKKFSRGWSFRLYAFFPAFRQIVFDCLLKLKSEFAYGVGVKADDAPNT